MPARERLPGHVYGESDGCAVVTVDQTLSQDLRAHCVPASKLRSRRQQGFDKIAGSDFGRHAQLRTSTPKGREPWRAERSPLGDAIARVSERYDTMAKRASP